MLNVLGKFSRYTDSLLRFGINLMLKKVRVIRTSIDYVYLNQVCLRLPGHLSLCDDL